MWTGVIIGRIGSISSESWPTIWIMLEVNLISFLPLLTQQWSVKKVRILYFIVQSVGSLSLLAGGVISDRTDSYRKWVTIGLLLKASLSPLHFWGAPLVIVLNKWMGYFFLTWQKAAPVALLITVTTKYLLWIILIINRMVAVICGVGRKRLLLVIFFSGLLHMRWVMASPIRTAFSYFLLYTITTAPIFFTHHNLPLLMLNTAGLPPLTGFFIKLIVLQVTGTITRFFLLVLSVLLTYTYVRMFLLSSEKLSGVKRSTLLVCILGLIY